MESVQWTSSGIGENRLSSSLVVPPVHLSVPISDGRLFHIFPVRLPIFRKIRRWSCVVRRLAQQTNPFTTRNIRPDSVHYVRSHLILGFHL